MTDAEALLVQDLLLEHPTITGQPFFLARLLENAPAGVRNAWKAEVRPLRVAARDRNTQSADRVIAAVDAL